MSVCPPHAALELAAIVADAGFRGLYVDANAVSPDTATAIARSDRGRRRALRRRRRSSGRRRTAPAPRASSWPATKRRASRASSTARRSTPITLDAGAARRLGAQDGLRRLHQGHHRASARDPRAGPPSRRRRRAARGVADLAAGAGAPLRDRLAARRAQGVALHRRDGRDRRDLRRRRAARRLPSRRERDLQPARALQGRRRTATSTSTQLLAAILERERERRRDA